EIFNTSSINLIDTSMQKSSGKPKSIVWGTHIKQGNQISKDHWSATCNYCNEYWYKSSPTALENHLELLKTLCPVYEPPSRDVLSGHYLAQEIAFVSQVMIKQLNESKNLTIRSTLKILAKENLIEGGGLKQWIDTHWHTIYNSILTLESRDCSLANCFIDLACLGAAIRGLPENDYRNFCQQAIAIYNRRFAKFDDDAYILCFFLHPGYTVWAQETFRRIFLVVDNFYEKMGKKQKERKMLISQIRSYQHHTALFDWTFLKDNFLKNEDHICQLANKLFSVTPHAARYERIWSTLGCAKDLYEVLFNMNSSDDNNYDEEQPASEEEQDVEFPEEEVLNIEELLNLDTADFTNDLGEIVFDTSFEFSKEENNV
ncbi:26045_t:CDS:2, partial [Gigaspora margarita]